MKLIIGRVEPPSVTFCVQRITQALDLALLWLSFPSRSLNTLLHCLRCLFPVFLPQRTLRSEEHTSELQSHSDLVCRLLLEKKKIHLDARRREHAYAPLADHVAEALHYPRPVRRDRAARSRLLPQRGKQALPASRAPRCGVP